MNDDGPGASFGYDAEPGAGVRSRLTVSFGERLDLDMLVAASTPRGAQALVVPQDVNLIMGEVRAIEDTRETAEQVIAAARTQRPRTRGSILVAPERTGEPLLVQAIVYDFEEDPPARQDHVFEALLGAFEEANRRGLMRLALRPLGTAHAGLTAEEFFRLLAQVCYSAVEVGTTIGRVQLLLEGRRDLERYEELLREQMGQ
jgi:hypothetical protein